jgi:hypothetical protein
VRFGWHRHKRIVSLRSKISGSGTGLVEKSSQRSRGVPVGIREALRRSILAFLVLFFLKGCLIVLPAIKHAENGHLVSIHVERDRNAFSVVRDP